MGIEELKDKIKEIVKDVFTELGGGKFLGEGEFQRALAIGFKKNGLKYLREPNVEIIYKGESIRPQGGEIDFIVFDEKEENGIILEIKHEGAKDEIFGKGVSQAWIYFKSLKDDESTFPGFIREKIKGALVINFADEEKQIGKVLLESEKVDFEQTESGEQILGKYTKDIEIWNIHTELTRKKEKKK
jgi:hypothetical protein